MKSTKIIPVLALCVSLAVLTLRCGGGGTSPPPPSGGPIGGTLTLTSLNPIVAMQNGPAFTLTVNGSGFTAGDQVTFNGASEPTTLANSQQLTAQIPASALAAPSAPNGFPVAVTGGSNSSSPLAFYVVPQISPSTITVSANATTSGVSIQPATLTPTLQLQAIGGCVCSSDTRAGVAAVTVGPGTTENLFVVGNGVVAGTFFSVTGNGITVTEPITANFTQTTAPATPAVNFNITISSGAMPGPRNLMVTNPAGEISVYPGAVVVGSGS